MAGILEYRCKSCKNLFFKGVLIEGELEVKCKKCHELTTVRASKMDDYLCLVYPCPHRISPKKDIPKKDIPST